MALGLTTWSNMIVRDSARRQLRAYLTVEPSGVIESSYSDGYADVAVKLINHGQTPAHHVRVFAKVLIHDDPINFVPQQQSPTWGDAHGDIYLGPGHEIFVYGQVPALSEAQELAVKLHDCAIMHYGVVEYLDAFNVRRMCYFSHYHWGPELTSSNAKRSRRGNEAT